MQTAQQMESPPASAGSVTSPLVRGMKRSLTFEYDFSNASLPTTKSIDSNLTTTATPSRVGTIGCSESNGGPDYTRILENMTQASIYQKRMRKNNNNNNNNDNSNGNSASTNSDSTAGVSSASATTGSAAGQAGFKKYLCDRYFSDKEETANPDVDTDPAVDADATRSGESKMHLKVPHFDQRLSPAMLCDRQHIMQIQHQRASSGSHSAGCCRHESNSSSSHPSVDFESDPFSPGCQLASNLQSPISPFSSPGSPGHSATRLCPPQVTQRQQLQVHCRSAPQTSHPLSPQFVFPPKHKQHLNQQQQQQQHSMLLLHQHNQQLSSSGRSISIATAPVTPNSSSSGTASPAEVQNQQQTQQQQPQRQAHPCRECGRVFNRSDMLSRHSRLHSNTRPYECPLCSQAFSRSDHLSTHMRTHTGEKPYVCKVCNYSACRKDMITRHMKIHRKHSKDTNNNNNDSNNNDNVA